MAWGEALSLTRSLSADPSSRVGAALSGWSFPVSREWLALYVIAENATAKDTQKRPRLRTVPAPWDAAPRRMGSASMTPQEMRRVLDWHRAMTEEGEDG